jgi:hypothetical protein
MLALPTAAARSVWSRLLVVVELLVSVSNLERLPSRAVIKCYLELQDRGRVELPLVDAACFDLNSSKYFW